MKLIDLIKYLRVNILDDRGGHKIDWTSITEDSEESVMLRWSNEELTAYIQEALYQVYRRILPAHGYYTELDINVLPGQSVYDLDSRILRVFSGRLLSSKRDLTLCDLQQLNKNGSDNSFLDETGNPTSLIVDYTAGQIRVHPQPDFSNLVETPPLSGTFIEQGEQLTLLVNRLPLRKLKFASSLSRVEIRDEFAVPMLDYAAYLSYSKDEANTLDPQGAERRLVAFNREFPQTSAYSDVRKRRSTRNQTRYGGL